MIPRLLFHKKNLVFFSLLSLLNKKINYYKNKCHLISAHTLKKLQFNYNGNLNLHLNLTSQKKIWSDLAYSFSNTSILWQQVRWITELTYSEILWIYFVHRMWWYYRKIWNFDHHKHNICITVHYRNYFGYFPYLLY